MMQLSGHDTLFLTGEQRNVYNHVSLLSIYDVSTAPGGQVRFKDILAHIEDRLYLHPIFRRRLATAPLGIDRPYWVEDAQVDVEFHIRHIALPKPGDWRQLMIQIARLHSRPLDRSRPLWEAYVIEGLDHIPKLPAGSFAVFYKFHHASVDGVAGIRLVSDLHALAPNEEPPLPDGRAVLADRFPLPLELAARAVGNAVDRATQLGRLARRLARTTAELRMARRELVPEGLQTSLFGRAPRTRFSGAVSAHRVVEGFGMPLSRIRRVRAKVPGVSLNDIFLAVAGGAIRKYLEIRGELPQRSVTAMMPIALASDGIGANQVGAAIVALRSDLADPLTRLRQVSREAAQAKHNVERLGPDLFKQIFNALPSGLSNLYITRAVVPQINATVSNVRGPDVPMYLAGAKAMCFYPVSIPSDGIGLNITGASYNGVMWVSVVSCRNMLHDPERFLAGMKESWEELLAAADALPALTIKS